MNKAMATDRQPDAFDSILAGLFQIEYEYPEQYALPAFREQVERGIEFAIRLMATIEPSSTLATAASMPQPGAFGEILSGLTRIEQDYPTLYAIPELRDAILRTIATVTEMQRRIAESSNRASAAASVIVLNFDRLLHYPPEN